MNPFTCKVEEQDLNLLDKISGLQNGEKAKQIFDGMGHHEMWLCTSMGNLLILEESSCFYFLLGHQQLTDHLGWAQDQKE